MPVPVPHVYSPLSEYIHMIYPLYQLTMEENAQRDSEISVNIPETPETPTQTPLVRYNAM